MQMRGMQDFDTREMGVLGTVRNLLIGAFAGVFTGILAFCSEAVFGYADILATLF